MLWFRVSKALDRSINMEIGKVFLSIAEITLSINSIDASSVEWLSLKPYCPSWSNLLHMKYSDNWRKTTFSNSFEIDGKSDIGRKLSITEASPFLNNGITLAIFNLSRNIPVIRDWFVTRVRGFSRAGDINFNNLVDMPLCPDEFFVRKDDKVLVMWFSPTR